MVSMKQFIIGIVVVGLATVGLSLPHFALAQTPSPTAVPSPTPTPVATTSGIIQAGPHFYSGENVVITENLQGDVFAAGGTVRLEGSIEGDLLVAGGEVIVNGPVTQDIRAVGGTVTIAGQVGGNVTALGGTVTIDDDAVVGNSVLLAGGTLITNGLVAGQAWLAGENVVIDNQFGSDVQAWANTLSVMPATTVAGQFQAKLTEEPEISEQAIFQEQPQVEIREEAAQPPVSGGFNIVTIIVVTVMNLTLGVILLYFFPRLSQKLTNSLLKGPLVTLGWGFVQLLLIPLMIGFLLLTIVGIPLAILLGISYVAALMVAHLVAALALGTKVATTFSAKSLSDPYAQLIIGVISMSVLTNIPYIGPVISFIALVFGLGALFIAFKSSLRTPRTTSKKLT